MTKSFAHYQTFKEEVIFQINPANSNLFAGLIRQIATNFGLIRQIVTYLPDNQDLEKKGVSVA